MFGNIDDTRSGPPIYHIHGNMYEGRGESIPDILRVISENSRGFIGILDAKYYCPNISGNKIFGAPSNSDISKQITYYRYLKQLYPESNILFTNVFLLPSITGQVDCLYRHIGYVINNNVRNQEIKSIIMSLLQEPLESIDKVLIYQINPEKLYKMCLSGEKIGDRDFINDFILPFQT